MNKPDVIIIGGGLVGSMTAKYLRKQGIEGILILDSRETMAASKCSFGVWKDGWINEKITDYVNQGREFLEEVCDGISIIEFNDLGTNSPLSMNRVDCSLILNEIIHYREVTAIKNDSVTLASGEVIIAKKAVIVAAGAYTDTILKKAKYNKTLHNLDRQWGAVLEVDMKIDTSRILTWAPYKQSVLLKRNNKEFVFGDGASVKNPGKNDKRIEMVSNRLIIHMNEVVGSEVDMAKIVAVNEGLRPYLPKGEHEYVKQHDKKLFSATGGAKNTTILCSYMAQELYRRIKEMKN